MSQQVNGQRYPSMSESEESLSVLQQLSESIADIEWNNLTSGTTVVIKRLGI